MATRILVVAAPLSAAAMAFAGCDSQGVQDDTPRFNYPVDAPDEDTALPDAFVPARDAGGDVLREADADAGPVVVRALATGSGAQADPLVGNGDHTCVISGPTRSLYCWGANDHGQIGNGKSGAAAFTEDVASATKIAIDETGLPFDGLEEVSLAAWHSCARKADLLFCWGQRLTSAQAEPPSAANLDRTAPRAIGNFDVTGMSAGGPHTCAITSAGKLACFGHSTFSELGRPSTDDVPCTAPFFYDYQATATHQCAGTLAGVTFATPPGTTKVVSGEIHSCALAAGKVSCWGASGSGQLGRPGAAAAEPTPQIVVTDPLLLTALDGVTALANDGAKHTCALRANGVVCWGLNDVGQLGVDPVATPTRNFAGPVVTGTAGAKSVGVAERVSCVIRADATVACWGDDLAALADGGVGTSFTPVPVKGPLGVGLLNTVIAIAPGARHACALKNDGTVWCWGKNDRGQLGNGTKVDSVYPVKVTGLP